MTNALEGLHGLELIEHSIESGWDGDPYAIGRCLCGLSSWPEYWVEHTALGQSVGGLGREKSSRAVQAWFESHLDQTERGDADGQLISYHSPEPDLGTDRLIYHHPEGFTDD